MSTKLKRLLSGRQNLPSAPAPQKTDQLVERLREVKEAEDEGREVPPKSEPAKATGPVRDPDIPTMPVAAVRDELVMREVSAYLAAHKDRGLDLRPLELKYLSDVKAKVQEVVTTKDAKDVHRALMPQEQERWRHIQPKIITKGDESPDLIDAAIVEELRSRLAFSRAASGPTLAIIDLARIADLELPKPTRGRADLGALSMDELRFLRSLYTT